jgi:hypothetical protein
VFHKLTYVTGDDLFNHEAEGSITDPYEVVKEIKNIVEHLLIFYQYIDHIFR